MRQQQKQEQQHTRGKQDIESSLAVGVAKTGIGIGVGRVHSVHVCAYSSSMLPGTGYELLHPIQSPILFFISPFHDNDVSRNSELDDDLAKARVLSCHSFKSPKNR